MAEPDSKTAVEVSLRDKVVKEHAAAIGAAETAVSHAINCGRYLTQLKDALPHGSFLAYVERNFDFTRQTASGYMRLAVAADKGELENASSIRGALKQLAAPPKSDPPSDSRFAELEAIIGSGLRQFPEFVEELEEAEELIAKGDDLGDKEAWDLGERMDALREKLLAAMSPFDRYWLRHKGFVRPDDLKSIEETCEVASMRPMIEDTGDQYVWVGFAPAGEDGGIENPLSYHPGWASYCRSVLRDQVRFATEDLMPPRDDRTATTTKAAH
jgi:hypothetical protein